MASSDVLGAVARGVAAGAVGTAAMTVSELLEMAVSGREASKVPGKVGAHLTPGKDPGLDADVEQLNTAVHWVHGVTMGGLRGALDLAGLRVPQASIAHFALLWGGDAVLYRVLGIAEVPWRWTIDELATDLLHKGVYAAATGAAYEALSS